MRTFALVDCNNFYVSCERVFRPDLRNRPVVVLSSNDGCIIARSEEAKSLGISMGVPEFKVRPLLREHNVAVFSSNYALYGDLSRRMLDVLRQYSSRLESYSIDEAFMEIPTEDPRELDQFAAELRQNLKHWIGIPVSIGMAPTKTLAKVANRIGKKKPETNGRLCLLEPEQIDSALAEVPVDDVWGIGYRYAAQLHGCGVHTALQFSQRDDKWIRTHMTILGLRTAYELRGMSCIEIFDRPPQRKEFIVSRTFGSHLSDFNHVKDAITSFAQRAAEKLQREKLIASAVTVYIQTDRFRDMPQNHCSVTLELEVPTNTAPKLVHYSTEALRQLFKPGYLYRKGGVVVHELTSERLVQETLFSFGGEREELPSPAELHLLAKDEAPWQQRAKYLSPRYTTRWDELLRVTTGSG